MSHSKVVNCNNGISFVKIFLVGQIIKSMLLKPEGQKSNLIFLLKKDIFKLEDSDLCIVNIPLYSYTPTMNKVKQCFLY